MSSNSWKTNGFLCIYNKYIYKVIVFHFFFFQRLECALFRSNSTTQKKNPYLKHSKCWQCPRVFDFKDRPFLSNTLTPQSSVNPLWLKHIALPIPLQVKYNMYILLLLLCSVYIQHPQRSMIVSVLIIDTIFFLAIHTIGTWSEN